MRFGDEIARRTIERKSHSGEVGIRGLSPVENRLCVAPTKGAMPRPDRMFRSNALNRRIAMRVFRRLLAPWALLLLALFAVPRDGVAQVAVSVTVAPPALPVYVQPPLPGPGWMWAPGYWAWGPYGYYWVPGTWVRPPRVGFLWTPGYWGWLNGAYIWHAGYWGPHIGFYGGINYGFGYIGVGYFGGRWDHGAFRYNAAVNNLHNVHITNVYRQTTVNNINITRTIDVTHVSFNGGRGGIAAQPTRQELAAAHDRHVPATALQARHATMARANPGLRLAANHGHPAIAATPRPAAFAAHGVVHAQGAAASHPHPAVRRVSAVVRPHEPHPQPHHAPAAQDHKHQPNDGGPARPE
jgi:hypothetical protein